MPPPALEDVVFNFATRLPVDAEIFYCPCGSSQSFQRCCGPLLLDKENRKCETMTYVLRSRYTAFSYRYIPHIIETTHPSCRDYRTNRVVWAQDLNQSGMFDSFSYDVHLLVLRLVFDFRELLIKEA